MVHTRRSGCREHGEGPSGRRRIITTSLLLLEDDNPEREQRGGVQGLWGPGFVGSRVCGVQGLWGPGFILALAGALLLCFHGWADARCAHNPCPSPSCHGNRGQQFGPSVKLLTKPEVSAAGNQTMPVASRRSAVVICQPIRNLDGRRPGNCI